jgi:hypothetical protein
VPGTAGRELRMLDIAGILFSTVMIAYIVIQAIQLDRIQAWFQVLKDGAAPTASPGTWNRRA